jgi:hypothetical protein
MCEERSVSMKWQQKLGNSLGNNSSQTRCFDPKKRLPGRAKLLISKQQAMGLSNLLNRCRGHVPATRCYMPSKWASRIERISQVPVVDFGCFVRVAHRNGPDYGICDLPELLANFWQNGFLMTSPLEGESENCLVFIGDLNGGPGWT